MAQIVLIIHLVLALAIIALVLLQRSEGGGLGIGGNAGLGGLASPGGTASALTRATAICAGCFFVTSLVLGILAGGHARAPSLIDALERDASGMVVLQDLGPDDVEVPLERPSVPLEE